MPWGGGGEGEGLGGSTQENTKVVRRHNKRKREGGTLWARVFTVVSLEEHEAG